MSVLRRYSVTTEQMSKILDFSGGMFYNKQLNASTYLTLLGLFITITLRKINQDNLNGRDDYGVPFSEQQYTHGFCYISLFKYKSFDRSDPLESPQILDIYSVVVL